MEISNLFYQLFFFEGCVFDLKTTANKDSHGYSNPGKKQIQMRQYIERIGFNSFNLKNGAFALLVEAATTSSSSVTAAPCGSGRNDN